MDDKSVAKSSCGKDGAAADLASFTSLSSAIGERIKGKMISGADHSKDVTRISNIGSVSKILRAAARTTGLRFTAVARVTDTAWTACAVYDDLNFGLKPGEELDLESTLCNEIRQHRQAIIIDEVTTDPKYRDHHTPKRYGFQSYVSIPIVLENGDFFGTLCALDPLPAKVSDGHVVSTLELFAQLIAAELNREEQLTITRDDLDKAQELGKLREQLLAVMGHDLRNPLTSIVFGAEALWMTIQNAAQLKVVAGIQRSCTRMSELITNILDLARGSMVDQARSVTVHPIGVMQSELTQVVDEIRNGHEKVVINFSFSITTDIECDRRRVAQLLGNLLANAVAHGEKNSPISILATTQGGLFELVVENHGQSIPAEQIPLLFQPFRRGASGSNQEGLGLGLFICAEIARVQGGEIDAESTPNGLTRFSFRMPVRRV